MAVLLPTALSSSRLQTPRCSPPKGTRRQCGYGLAPSTRANKPLTTCTLSSSILARRSPSRCKFVGGEEFRHFFYDLQRAVVVLQQYGGLAHHNKVATFAADERKVLRAEHGRIEQKNTASIS
ncbi:hypothetical protein PC128_g23102 [Phytophthora cactorum]|nr:hypothetical protein PC128_g23102 [Phytophthora cactorum]